MYQSEEIKHKFYYPDRSPMNRKDEFIYFYSQEYYCRIKDIEFEKHIEQDIFQSKENLSKKDIIDIMRWKTGGEYIDKNLLLITFPRKKYINIEHIFDYVKDRCRGCCRNPISEQDDGYKKLIKSIIGEKGNGMGMVYAITIIYFLSNGKYPIYDRFADIGRFAITKDIKPGEGIKYKELSQSFEKAYMRYQGYAKDLISIFGEQDYTNRALDRALWSYGHLFNVRINQQVIAM